MPVKESTLRFKIEGLQDVQGAVGVLKQAARDMRADEVAVQRTHKVVQEALNAGKFPSEVARKNAVAAEENQQRTISNISFKAENDRRRTAVRFLDQQYSQDIESFKGDTEQKAAYEATYESKRRTLTDAIAGEEAKRAAERARIAQDEAKIAHQREVKRGQVILKEQMAEQKFAEQENKTQNQKLIEADRYARKQELEQEKTTSRKEQDGIKLGKAESAAYDQENKTQNQKLIEADRYARKQELEQEKTTSRKEQDAIKLGKAESAAYDMEAKRNKEGGKTGGRGGMSGFGGKMLIGYAASQMVGNATGSAQAGQIFGVTVSAAMFGGPQVAAAVAGMELMGVAVNTYREKIAAATEATRTYSNAVMQMSSAWSATSKSQIQMSKFGEAMQSESDRAGQMAVASGEKLGELLPHSLGDWMARIALPKAAYAATDAKISAAYRQTRMGLAEMKLAADQKKEEYEKSFAGRESVFKEQQKVYALSGMAPGYEKQQQELSATQARDREALKQEHESQQRAANAAIVKETETLKLLEAEKKNIAVADVGALVDNENKQKVQKQRIEDAQTAKDALGPQQELESKNQVEAQRAEQANFVAKHQEQQRQLEYSAKVALIKATTVGHEQELALQEAARQEAARKALLDGFDITQQLTNEKTAQAKLDAISVQDALARFDAEAATAKQDRERNDLRAKGATQEQITTIELGEYQKQYNQADIDARLSLNQITLEQAALERAMLNDKRGQTQESIKEVVRAQENAAALEDARKYRISAAETELQTMTKRHMISLKDADLARILLQDRRAYEAFEAVKAGKANDQQKELVKDVEAEVNARERLRGTEVYNAGQFSTKYSAGYVNFAALNQNRMYGALRGSGSFETGQAGQTFLPNTLHPRWSGEALGAGKGTSPTPGPSKADVDRAKVDAEILRTATIARLNSDPYFARAYEAAKSRQNYDADILRRSEAATVQSPAQATVGAKGGDGSNSVVGELKEVCRILERIAANGGLH